MQKEREILEKTGGQILWIHGEEAHSGSHSVDYAYAARCGGGVLIGKGCHPLTAALYLKRVEGRARDGKPIRPKTVSARTHAITRLPDFRDEGHIRSDYYDIDDFSMMHVEFDDGTIADVFASDIVLGGIHNWLEVCANNHRTLCNINPNTAMQTYNPVEENFADIYVVEKIGTKQGWACTSPEEDWFTGYPQEIEAFYRTIAYGEPAGERQPAGRRRDLDDLQRLRLGRRRRRGGRAARLANQQSYCLSENGDSPPNQRHGLRLQVRGRSAARGAFAWPC